LLKPVKTKLKIKNVKFKIIETRKIFLFSNPTNQVANIPLTSTYQNLDRQNVGTSITLQPYAIFSIR
jgi:hypothetical protein